MKIKKQYELNEDAWIHLGGDRLSKGHTDQLDKKLQLKSF